MSNSKWWKIEEQVLERLSRSQSYIKTKKEFPPELKIQNSKFTYRLETGIGLSMITLPWFFLLIHFTAGTFFTIGIMIIMGLFLIIIAQEKVKKNRYDIRKEGITFQGKLLEWNKISEIQRVRLSNRRRTEVLRIITNETPIDLPFNSDLNPKPYIIKDYINYRINNN